MKTYTKYGMPLAITESVSEVGEDFYEAYDEAAEQLMCDRKEIQVKEGEDEIIFYDPSLKKSPQSFVESTGPFPKEKQPH
jgi:hypothetical protein